MGNNYTPPNLPPHQPLPTMPIAYREWERYDTYEKNGLIVSEEIVYQCQKTRVYTILFFLFLVTD